MHTEKKSTKLRRLLWAFKYHFDSLFKHGEFLSIFQGMPLDAKADNLPWYSEPAIKWLQAHCWRGWTVYEWGAGSSTLWWIRNAAAVNTVEDDKKWFEKLVTSFSYRFPRKLLLRFSKPDDVKDYVEGFRDIIVFDLEQKKPCVFVVDGSHRFECIQFLRNLILDHMPLGPVVIILDNSEWFPTSHTSLRSMYVSDTFDGFMDFVGKSPIVDFDSQTTFALKSTKDALKPIEALQRQGQRFISKDFETHLNPKAPCPTK